LIEEEHGTLWLIKPGRASAAAPRQRAPSACGPCAKRLRGDTPDRAGGAADRRHRVSTPLKAGLTLATVAKSLGGPSPCGGPKAVALVINSPAGRRCSSHLIYRRIRALAAETSRPVNRLHGGRRRLRRLHDRLRRDEIVCDPSSIIGSIGVVAVPSASRGLMDKLGIERRLYTSGENKAMLDPFRRRTPRRRAAQPWQHDIHEDFILLVKGSRGRAAQRPRKNRVLWGILDRQQSDRARLGRQHRRLCVRPWRERFGENVVHAADIPRGAGSAACSRA